VEGGKQAVHILDDLELDYSNKLSLVIIMVAPNNRGCICIHYYGIILVVLEYNYGASKYKLWSDHNAREQALKNIDFRTEADFACCCISVKNG
jgi:hypothetical protein